MLESILKKYLNNNVDFWQAKSGTLQEHAEKLRFVYELLADEESREIFADRVLMHFLYDIKYHKNLGNHMIEHMNRYHRDARHIMDYDTIHRGEKTTIQKFASKINLLRSDEEIIIYGVGDMGKLLLEYLEPNANLIFCDRRAAEIGDTFFGYPLISLEQLAESYSNQVIAVTPIFSSFEIYWSLRKMGIKQERIIFPGHRYDDLEHQYFDSEILTPLPEEHYIDVGIFNLHTVLQFIKWCEQETKAGYAKIIGFEPDPLNYKYCCELMDKLKICDVKILQAAAWNEKTLLNFDAGKGGISQVVLNNSRQDTVSVEADTIDNILCGQKCTFIKMDTEGAEIPALQGARETIIKWHPRLAISYYHRIEDLYEIPLLIYSYSDSYKFYLRHYSNTCVETVLYAL